MCTLSHVVFDDKAFAFRTKARETALWAAISLATDCDKLPFLEAPWLLAGKWALVDVRRGHREGDTQTFQQGAAVGGGGAQNQGAWGSMCHARILLH